MIPILSQERTTIHFQQITADAAAYYRRGQMEEAVACYRRALALRPECAELESNLGVALEAQGSLEEEEIQRLLYELTAKM